MCLVKINLPSRLNRILNIITLIISLSMSSFILYHCALCNVKIVSKFLVKGNVKTRIVVSAECACKQFPTGCVSALWHLMHSQLTDWRWFSPNLDRQSSA